ncbi:MAG: hypothetical protein WBK96_12410 [Candidatus Manganitrophaceae bacterium]
MIVINCSTLPRWRRRLRRLSFRDQTAVLFMATCKWLFERWIGIMEPECREEWHELVVYQAERMLYADGPEWPEDEKAKKANGKIIANKKGSISG